MTTFGLNIEDTSQEYRGNIPIKGRLACKINGCGSSDAVTLYENPIDKSRFYKCYSCGKAYKALGASITELDEIINSDLSLQENLVSEKQVKFSESFRGLNVSTLDLYQVRKDLDGNILFNYFNYDNKLMATKVRYPDKSHVVRHKTYKGFQQSGLFGHQIFPQGGKYITITEGEYDAMSVYELTGSKYACVSLKSGAESKLTQEDYKYLNSFDNIIFCGDNDVPGRKAAERFSTSFPKNKVRIVKLSQGKDANEYLEKIREVESQGKLDESQEYLQLFIREWWRAEPFTPEGLVQGKNTLDIFLAEDNSQSVPYPWNGLQEVLHGIRTSELIVLSSGSGVGKSATIKELAYHLYKILPQEKIGCMFLEESLRRTVKDFVGMELGINLRFPENVVEQGKRTDAWNVLFDNDRWIFWDHFGSNDIDTVCNQVRFIATNFGARYIFLDHISIIISDGSHGDERKALDQIMTKLRTLVQELDICLFVVSHLRRSNDSIPHEEGGVTSLSQLRGSAGIGQLADIVIGLERNGQAENQVERNVTTIRILKNRFTGETGPACYVLWNKQSGRLKEIESYAEVQRLITMEEQMKVLDPEGKILQEA